MFRIGSSELWQNVHNIPCLCMYNAYILYINYLWQLLTFENAVTENNDKLPMLILVDQSGRHFCYILRILMQNMFSIRVQSCVTSLQNKSHDRTTLQWLDMLNSFLMNHKREVSCLTGDDNIVHILCVCHSHGSLKH